MSFEQEHGIEVSKKVPFGLILRKKDKNKVTYEKHFGGEMSEKKSKHHLDLRKKTLHKKSK